MSSPHGPIYALVVDFLHMGFKFLSRAWTTARAVLASVRPSSTACKGGILRMIALRRIASIISPRDGEGGRVPHVRGQGQ
jgi:hypothetical protein